ILDQRVKSAACCMSPSSWQRHLPAAVCACKDKAVAATGTTTSMLTDSPAAAAQQGDQSMNHTISRRAFLAGTGTVAAATVLHPYAVMAQANQAHLRIIETTDIHVAILPYD